jgi:hypothetical protein
MLSQFNAFLTIDLAENTAKLPSLDCGCGYG